MNQLYVFSSFILTGFAIGILYDIFRILRRSFKTADIITYIQDFIFWILTGLILLYSIFTFNNGELRSFIFIGIITGIIIYILLVSKFFIKGATKTIYILKKILYIPINKIYIVTKKYIFRPINTIIYKIKLGFPKIRLKKDKNNKI